MKTRRNNCSSRKGCGCGNQLFGKIGGGTSAPTPPTVYRAGARGANPFYTDGLRRQGGYKPTKKNLETLRRWKRGLSIGFTATSSLKAKGLIPRTGKGQKGMYVVSSKYRGGQKAVQKGSGCGCSGARNVLPYPTGLWAAPGTK